MFETLEDRAVVYIGDGEVSHRVCGGCISFCVAADMAASVSCCVLQDAQTQTHPDTSQADPGGKSTNTASGDTARIDLGVQTAWEEEELDSDRWLWRSSWDLCLRSCLTSGS